MTMNAVGIDVSKGRSTVCVLRPGGEVVHKPYDVLHTGSGLQGLADYLCSLEGETMVVMEHTGRYYEPVANFLHNAGLCVCAVNPLLLKGYGNNTLRKVKTDKADARKIARYTLDNWSELREYRPMDTIRYQLKMLNRQRALYVKQTTALKNSLIALLDQTYPGVNSLFTSSMQEDGSQKWVDFAYDHWHVDIVRHMGRANFVKHYKKWCREHGYQARTGRAEQIYDGARDLYAVLPMDDVTQLVIQQEINALKGVSSSLAAIKVKMNELASQLPEYPVVMSMGSVGSSTGPQLMAEIGDVTKFAHRGSLTAFAGVDPCKDDSGQHDSKSVKTSKRGSPELRQTLFVVMENLIKRAPPDDEVFRFMDKKRSEGKPYYVYMTAGANKFLRLYYGKVREYLATLDDPPREDSGQ